MRTENIRLGMKNPDIIKLKTIKTDKQMKTLTGIIYLFIYYKSIFIKNNKWMGHNHNLTNESRWYMWKRWQCSNRTRPILQKCLVHFSFREKRGEIKQSMGNLIPFCKTENRFRTKGQTATAHLKMSRSDDQMSVRCLLRTAWQPLCCF